MVPMDLPPEGVPGNLDPEMTLVLRRAAWLGRRANGPPTASFTSLLLGFLTSGGALCEWAESTSRRTGPRPEDIVLRWTKQRGGPPDFEMARLDQARALEPSGLPPLPVESTPSVKEVLRIAGLLASDIRPRQAIGCRHVLATYLYRPPGHLDDYDAWKLDRGAWAESFIERVISIHPDERADWLKLHTTEFQRRPGTREAPLASPDAGAAGTPRFAGYDNDDAHGDDRLDIGREVHALAAVLASHQITPPLSVGLFGDWGSGKSFFMNELRDRIETLAWQSREAKKANRPTSYCGEVIQIGFNAWHYMDGNLWASLVAHIFDELNAELNKHQKPSVEAFATELASVVERRGELQREKDAIEAGAKKLDEALAEQRVLREKKQLSWSDFVNEVLRGKSEAVRAPLESLATQLGLDRAELTLDEARAEKQRLEHLAGRVGAWWRHVRGSPPKLALALALLMVPIAVAATLAATPAFLEDGRRAVGSLTAALASVIAVASWVRSRATPAVKMIDDAIALADRAEQEVRSRISKEEAQLRSEREQMAAAEAKLEQERASLAEKQAAIEAELQALKDGRSFKKYVLERAASDDYRKQLGLIASVHRDFSKLSERLGNAEDEPYVERIVLYIDDLDRCPPERVVEVLQAVHLILAMKLFVVVVAVDSRWLLQSLDAYYARQFHRADGAWESKPQHYLEKIFQIPFTLPPMSAAGFNELVTGLLNPHLARPGPPAGSASAGLTQAAGVESAANTAAASPKKGGGSAAAGAKPAEKPDGSKDIKGRPKLDLMPRNLQIEQAELDFVMTLAPLISTPRSAKRLVNLYRIVRATLDDEALRHFVAGRYRTTQLVLAAVVGSPTLAAELFEAIFAGRIADGGAVTRFLAERAAADARWASLAAFFKDRPELTDWKAVRAAAHTAARYSFETGRVLRPTSFGGPAARAATTP